MTPMRVAFYGNIANNFYQIAKALRRHTDIDAVLYLKSDDQLTTLPESDDPALKGRYPDWIVTGKYFGPSTLLTPWRSPLVRHLRAADLSIVSELGPVYAQFCGKPTCFFTTGSDLTQFPFPHVFLPRRRWLTKAGIIGFIQAYWLRRGIRRMTEIWTQPFAPYMAALSHLGIPADDRRIAPAYFPLIIDTDMFRFDPAAAADPMVADIKARCDFILFHPSRLMIQDAPALRRSGQWKQNDLLFRGFAAFLRRLPPEQAARAALVMPDRTLSNDVPLAKRMISEMGLDANVVWLKAQRPQGFTRHELIKLYSAADGVADDFGAGWFGSVVLEGASIGRPILSYIDEAPMRQLYDWHPILSAHTEEGIAQHLYQLHQNPAYKAEVGARGRAWIEAFHAEAAASSIYVQRIYEIAERLGISTPPKGQ